MYQTDMIVFFHPSILSVSIPFKREILSELTMTLINPYTSPVSFHSLQTGNTFRTEVTNNLKVIRIISFHSLQTGNTFRT